MDRRFSRIVALAMFCATGFAVAEPPADFIVQWDRIALQGIRDSKLGAPMAARSLAIVHTCMYDAWAAYDERAAGTQLPGTLRRPTIEHTLANKEQAVSYAAYRALMDVLPANAGSTYTPFLKQLGYDPKNTSSKAGILALTKSAAQEYACRGIRVNALVAGGFDTDMLRTAVGQMVGDDPEKIEAALAGFAGQVPLGRIGRPEEAAQAAPWFVVMTLPT